MPEITAATRDAWLLAADQQLLAQCQEHRYRASGPGGQHRNKTESAIRLVHRPTGITVTATERRSQHENRAKAIERLREAIAVQVRCPIDRNILEKKGLLCDSTRDGRIVIGRRDPRYLILTATVLDAVASLSGRVADAARLFDLSTSQLVSMLKEEPKRLAAANAIRAGCGLDPLR